MSFFAPLFLKRFLADKLRVTWRLRAMYPSACDITGIDCNSQTHSVYVVYCIRSVSRRVFFVLLSVVIYELWSKSFESLFFVPPSSDPKKKKNLLLFFSCQTLRTEKRRYFAFKIWSRTTDRRWSSIVANFPVHPSSSFLSSISFFHPPKTFTSISL